MEGFLWVEVPYEISQFEFVITINNIETLCLPAEGNELDKWMMYFVTHAEKGAIVSFENIKAIALNGAPIPKGTIIDIEDLSLRIE